MKSCHETGNFSKRGGRMSRSYHNQDADLKQELSGQLDKAGGAALTTCQKSALLMLPLTAAGP
jgi:hypothetical protein